MTSDTATQADRPPPLTLFEQANALEHTDWELKQKCMDANRWWGDLIRQRGIRYRACKISNYNCQCDSQTELVRKLQAYMRDIHANIEAGRNVMLFGPRGTGKDHLLMGLASFAIGCGHRVEWRNGVEIYSDIRDAMTNNETERSIASPLEHAPVLWISDPTPPSGALTEFQQAFLFRIIDRRYNHCLPTWLTMNVADRKETEEKLGSRTVDRLVDGAITHACDWESYRGKAS